MRVEGWKSVRPGATRTPNISITEGMMSYFLLRWAENKKLDWPNISVRGKYKIIGTLFNMELFFRNKKIVREQKLVIEPCTMI